MIRQPISQAAGALLKAMSPGPAAMINRIRSQPWKSLSFEGERIEIEWQCADQAEIDRAAALARQAAEIEIQLPGNILADMAARLTGPSFLIEALVVAE